jgi:hypothetical protein
MPMTAYIRDVSDPHVLAAGHGLVLHIEANGACRVAWGEVDWFGPAGLTVHHGGARFAGGHASPVADAAALAGAPRTEIEDRDALGRFRAVELVWTGLPFPLRTTVRAYADRALLVFRLVAPAGLAGAGSGTFAVPGVAWPHFAPRARQAGGVPEATTSYAHQWCEFALPLFGDADGRGFRFAPHRPPVVQPFMLIAPDGRTLLLAPLDQFHEQIIAVPHEDGALDDGLRCGWHGDLASAPAGFATELVVWAADRPRAALDAWIGFLRHRHAVERPSRYADVGLARLSYWTDNGAHYYYRTEPDADYLTTLERAVQDCEARGIPIGMVQIDSWFYPHEHLRPVSAEGAPLVPPSGMMRWEPREDLFPEGFATLQRRLGHRPLAFHSRHFARRSPYFERFAAWADGDYAHPQDDALFDHLLARAADWGAITYEQDWMVESFLGVRGLRAAAGRARAWQEQLDRAAAAHGLTLQWCMAAPADFLQTLTLRRLTSIRTSGDYRYLFDNGLNWVWFLHTNALARALGLNAFKDVFLSDRDAEPYAEIEALLAALSTGPVGVGDRIGRSDRDLVLRVAREDGTLVKPDAALAALDHCFQSFTYLDPRLLIGETYSAHPAGRWVYVVGLHASRVREPIAERCALAQLGAQRPQGPVVAYDWRARRWARLEPDGGWDIELAWQDWDLRILCPVLPGDRAVFGDVSKYASVGDRRVARIDAAPDEIGFDVLGAPHTIVQVDGCSPTPPAAVEVSSFAERRELPAGKRRTTDDEGWSWDANDGRWTVRVALRRTEAAHVRILWSAGARSRFAVERRGKTNSLSAD